ncbi:E3 ubiquitin-protein ligase upl6, partial [Globisporangium splendens]
MFDGNFKSSRKVNLSGRKKSFSYNGASASTAGSGSSSLSSKEQLMLQAKLAREERQTQRRQTLASTKIQALYRRIAAAAHVRTTVFCALEANLTQVVTTVDVKTTALPTATLVAYLRQFCFAVGQDIRKNIFAGSVAVSSASPQQWIGLQEIDRQRVLNVQNYLVFMLLVSCLRGTTQDANFLLAKKDSTLEKYPQSEETHRSYCTLMYKLAAHTQYGTFDALSDCIRANKAQTEGVEADRIVQVVSKVAVTTLRLSYLREEQQQQIVRQFAFKVLLTPNAVSSSVGRYVLSSLAPIPESLGESAVFWRSVVAQLAQPRDTKHTLSWTDRAIALGNVIDLLIRHNFEKSLVQESCVVMAALVSESIVRWTFEASRPIEKEKQMSEDYEMEDMAESQSALPVAQVEMMDEVSVIGKEAQEGARILREFDKVVRSQIEQLCSGNFSRRLLNGVLGSLDVNESFVSAFAGLCQVYATILQAVDRSYLLSVTSSFAPPAKPVFSFLSAVAADQLTADQTRNRDATTIERMWVMMGRQLRAEKDANRNTASVVYSASSLNMLLMFNTIYSHLLLGLDDETFYEREWPLRLPEVVVVVAFLKDFIYDTCWIIGNAKISQNSRGIASERDPTLFAAVATSVKLFNQLYDRDCRRRYAPDGAWLWPAMPIIRETVDLESMEDNDDQQDAPALHMLMSGAASSPHARAALILTTIPQVFSFNDRVLLFEKLLNEEKSHLRHVRDEFSGAIQVRIKRDEIVDQSFDFFQKVCDTMGVAALKSRMKITFINEQGLEEAGVDGGGVFKEYTDSLNKHAFSPEYGYFLATEDQLLYPNPAAQLIADTPREVIDRFRFLGRVLAKAVYENILVEPQFAAFFLNKLLGKFNYIDDLHSLDPELYKNLMQLKHYAGNVEDLALTFSVSEMEFGRVVTRNLVPDGANIPVTNENRIRYIHVMANYKLNVQASSESAAFLKGFRDLIPAKWIQMFSPSELQMLIGGSANNIDIDDWEKHTQYGGGYHPSQLPIQWFWDIVRYEFDAEERAALLKFITSCSRQPLLGFGQLAPQLCIHQVRTTEDERLPSSATCMNLLKLPTYSSKEIMRKKLEYAIKANAGFDLS